jgi:hypothetical protein
MSYSDFNNAYQNINHKLLETFDGITSEDLNTQLDYRKVPIHQELNNIKELIRNPSINNCSSTMLDLNGNYMPNLNDNSQNLNGTSIQNLNLTTQNTIKNTTQNTIKNTTQNTIKNTTQNTTQNTIKNTTQNTTQNLNNNKLTHRDCILLYLEPSNLKNQIMPIVLRHISNCSLCQNEIKNINESCKEVKIIESEVKPIESEVKTIESDNKINITISELEVLLKNVINKEKKSDEYENINQIFKALENKKNESKPFLVELNFLNITIFILIILIIIDIILRLKLK